MNRTLTALLAALALTPCALAQLAAAPTALAAPARDGGPGWDGRRHVVHEWGTFTSVQGSNSAALDGLLHEERGLPEFVYDLADYVGLRGLSPKMETPVIYFYAPGEWWVSVRVDFPRGLVTQWYPSATALNHRPAKWRGDLEQVEADAGALPLADGFIDWGGRGLRVLAPDSPEPLLPGHATGASPLLAPVDEDDPWRFSRMVGANLVQSSNLNRGRGRAEEAARDETSTEEERRVRIVREVERFLFYRGLGDFDLPLAVRAWSEERRGDRYSVSVAVDNRTAAEPCTALFLVRVDGERAGFARLSDVATPVEAGRVSMTLAPLAETTELLVEELAVALTGTGLYYDEALAMARTWQHGWFQDPGLRLLYVLPREFVDRELPLRVASRTVWDAEARRMVEGPEVDEVVRTFVGRTEILTPRRERELESVVLACAFGAGEERERATAELSRWGRFAAPYLARVAALCGDATVRAEVARLRESVGEAR